MTSAAAKDGVSQRGGPASLYPCVIVALSSRKPAHSEPEALTAHVTVILNSLPVREYKICHRH